MPCKMFYKSVPVQTSNPTVPPEQSEGTSSSADSAVPLETSNPTVPAEQSEGASSSADSAVPLETSSPTDGSTRAVSEYNFAGCSSHDAGYVKSCRCSGLSNKYN